MQVMNISLELKLLSPMLQIMEFIKLSHSVDGIYNHCFMASVICYNL